MNLPPLDRLMVNIDSRYSLVVIAAKRARRIIDALEKDSVEKNVDKPVTLALYEVSRGNVKYKRVKQGIK